MKFVKFFAVGAAAVLAAGQVSGKQLTGQAMIDQYMPLLVGGLVVGVGHHFLGT
jgi:hypothetical protein